MHKIALIHIMKNPTNNELREIHRLISARTATVEVIPQLGEEFITLEMPLTIFTCLRLDRSETNKPKPNSFDGHDATIYAVYSGHK